MNPGGIEGLTAGRKVKETYRGGGEGEKLAKIT